MEEGKGKMEELVMNYGIFHFCHPERSRSGVKDLSSWVIDPSSLTSISVKYMVGQLLRMTKARGGRGF